MDPALTEFLQDRVMLRNMVATLVLFVTVLGVRYASLRFIRSRLPNRDKSQLRWASQVRGFSYAILAFGLFAIWAAELQALAVSFAVLAMAIVWGTKETLACVQ
ncbi:MAG: hypothetical protein JSU89_06950, partial [Myxococcales bacterium]